MNIFVVSTSTAECARMYCDIHVNKMLTETVQLLSTAHHVLDGLQVGMKPTHANHPCAVWVRESISNYQWAYSLAVSLANEYSFRTGKIHKSSLRLDLLKHPPLHIKCGAMTDFAVAMPDEFKQYALINGVIGAYRKLLNHKYHDWTHRVDKKRLSVKWSKREKPHWVL